MATAIVSEYNTLSDTDGKITQIPKEPPLAEQSVTYTTAASPTNAFNADTSYICIIADAKAHYSVGASPTATASNKWVPADTMRCFGVTGGQTISFYDGST